MVPEHEFGIATCAPGVCLELACLHRAGHFNGFGRDRQRARRVVLPQRQQRQIDERTVLELARADGSAQPQRLLQMLARLVKPTEPQPVGADVGECDDLALLVAELAPDRQVLQVELPVP